MSNYKKPETSNSNKTPLVNFQTSNNVSEICITPSKSYVKSRMIASAGRQDMQNLEPIKFSD